MSSPLLKPLSTTLCGLLAFVQFSTAQAEITGNIAHLNARFNGLTLEAALTEVANHTGITIETSQALDKKVLLTFSDVSAEKLLKRLLHGYNAMYLRNPNTGELQSVRIFASSTAKPIITQDSQQPAAKEAQESNGKYYMLITLNGVSMKMLVDTGANTLAISQAVATQLGLSMGQPAPVNTAAGKTSAYKTIIESVTMAGKELKGVQAIILPNLTETGLIGQNVLAHYKQTTHNGKMHFESLVASNNTSSNNATKTTEQNTEATQPIQNSPNRTLNEQEKIRPDNLQKAIPQPKKATTP